MKVVWVVGAGFSAGLGGPLLPRLLSRHLQKEVEAAFPSTSSTSPYALLHQTAAQEVRDLYDYGLSDASLRAPNSKVHRENMWGHAEEFIDYLDAATEDLHGTPTFPNPSAVRLQQVLHGLSIKTSIEDLGISARRLIAAECTAFLTKTKPTREQWQPYRRWARSLGPNDTIISFNYDWVVEALIDHQNGLASKNEAVPSQIHVVLPGEDREEWARSCPLLKLHGSVNWCAAPDGTVKKADDVFAFTAPPAQLAIATPGPSKKRATKLFAELWRLAREALTAADALIFVGYRFPETDADAREQLLGAIGDNRAMHPLLHIVLGRSKDDAERLISLLQFVCRQHHHQWQYDGRPGNDTFTAVRHPLLAQDFFSVVRREALIVG